MLVKTRLLIGCGTGFYAIIVFITEFQSEKKKKRLTSNFEVRRDGKVYNLECIDAWYYSYNGIWGCAAGLGLVLGQSPKNYVNSDKMRYLLSCSESIWP